MSGINKRQNEFLVEIFGLFLGIKGKAELSMLRALGKRGEQGYRSRFSKNFDFLRFNGELVAAHGDGRRIIVLDPSYVRKSRKSTRGTRYFWLGVAGEGEWGGRPRKYDGKVLSFLDSRSFSDLPRPPNHWDRSLSISMSLSVRTGFPDLSRTLLGYQSGRMYSAHKARRIKVRYNAIFWVNPYVKASRA